MPGLNQLGLVFLNEFDNATDFVVRKAEVFAGFNWIEPNLDQLPIAFDVDVGRLSSIGTEENETVGADLQNGWHF
ncbi:hypothetical protein VPK24_15185 [Limnothrix redekei LRLZ20PSL1]|uniref:Uncharacterized protein n=1 Tax=Limnothrix redekei LRLZ20PSL1 TaxID=3112953 RepID=A0ABW7CCX4_9CYAN